ncbi:outer membrane factor of efflux pump [uncultured delta proteobacterium]|uniref:Outer membrane factor of efflux pump n=1 Tax=uncultured delta proteobacterium TaxID=34034 RepID=A0A212JB02_9DELT|nr:outer membrane factor of efflux pump [uncultured delta proteobacterium]
MSDTRNRYRAVALCLVLTALAFASSGCALLLHKDTDPKPMVGHERIRLAEDIRLARDSWPEAGWWLRFEDTQLSDLVVKALLDSPGMDVARARTEAAKAKIGAAVSNAGPLVGAMGMINRMRVSDAGFLGIYAEDIPLLGIHGPWYTTATVGLTGSWNLDIWGKDRAMIRATVGEANAQAAEQAQAELVLAGGVARLYFDIQALHSLLDLLEQIRAVEAEMTAASQERVKRGLEPRSTYEQARLRQLDLEEQVSNAQNDLRAFHEALRAIVGQPDLPPLERAGLPATQGRMPQTLGYELLARRPDLQAARWYVQASLDAVDAVKAAFYPSFNLLGFYGFDSMDATWLFNRGAQQIMFTPMVTLPIFDSGRLNAALREARTSSDMLIALYNEAVLNAVRDVALAGIRMQKIEAGLAIQEERLHSAAYLFESVNAYKKRGLADAVEAMAARLPLLAEQVRALELRRLHLMADIDLIQALGGGYRQEPPAPEK